jgi:hypothetical protein
VVTEVNKDKSFIGVDTFLPVCRMPVPLMQTAFNATKANGDCFLMEARFKQLQTTKSG